MLKPEYKQTDIGVLPEDWEVKTLGELGECIIGLTYNPANIDRSGVLVLRSSNIQNEELDLNDQVRIKMPIPEKLFVQEDDLLVCVRNGSRKLIGKCLLLDKRVKGASFGAFMSVYRSPYNHYIIHAFKSEIVAKQIEENLGATINSITNKDLNSYKIPFPPPAEQRAIADALGAVDALLTNQRELLAKKRALKQATQQALLSGEKRLPGFGGKAELELLGELIISKPPKSPSQGSNEIVSFVGMEDVSEYGQLLASRQLPIKEVNKGLTYFEKDDVLVAKITPCFENGKGAYLDKLKTRKGFGSTEFHVLRANSNAVGKYIFYHTQSGDFRQKLESEMIGTTGQKRVPLAAILNYRLPFGHSKEEQRAIATILSNMDAELETLTAQLDKTQALKQGMMQDLLTGTIRLVPAEAATPILTPIL